MFVAWMITFSRTGGVYGVNYLVRQHCWCLWHGLFSEMALVMCLVYTI